MTEKEGPKGPALYPIPLRPGSPTGGEQGKPKTTDDMFNEVMETLKKNMQLEGAARASKAYSMSSDGAKGGTPETPERSAVRPFQDLNDAAQIFGINFAQMMEQKDIETRALREATDSKDREIHELRLRSLTEMEERIRNAAAERRGGGGDLGTGLGLGELDPDVKRQIQERAFRLDGQSRADGGEPKQPAVFSREWFKEWGGLQQDIEGFAKSMGFSRRNEGDDHQQPASLVTMNDIKSGSIPIELALGLRKVEVDADLERTRIDKEDARENRRLDIFGQMSTTMKDNLPDLFAAIRDLASEHEQAAGRDVARGNGRGGLSGLKGMKCSDCGYQFAIEEELERYTCPRCGEGMDTNPAQTTTDERPIEAASLVTRGENGEELSV